MIPGLDRILEDTEAAGRAAKTNGACVVGYLGAAAPVEIIVAAGAVPIRLLGDPAGGTARADAWMEPVQEGALRTIFDRLIGGGYGWLDAIVVPRSSEQLLQFYHLAEHVRSAEPHFEMPPLHLFNLLQTPEPRSARFDRAEMERLRGALSALTGRKVDGAAITAAVAERNRLRRRITALSTARRTDGPALSGSDLLALSIAGQVLPARDFAPLLDRAEGSAGPRSGPRLVLDGNPPDALGLTRAIECAGARIVADGHDRGERVWDHEVAETADPIDGLVAHYQHHAPTPRLPVEAEEARFDALLREARPDGVILAMEANDDTFGWDVPRRVRAAEARGIPSLVLTGLSFFEESPGTAHSVATFIESLREARK